MIVFNEPDIRYMRHAFAIAEKGAGNVLPNPMVGAVVVRNNKIIGQGYHQKYGGDHAEVSALREAGQSGKEATLYVTLEPCAHYGKTPPCVEKIIEAGIKRVVVAMQDPNSLVAGRGIARLREAGIQVEIGLLEEEATRLNRPFIKYITEKQPYVTLKIAQTLDGRIADRNGRSKWITSEASRKLVHKWRFEAGAVLVGIGTVLADNPRLTLRHVVGKQPLRIVLDSKLRIPLDCELLSDQFTEKTIIMAKDSDANKEKEKAIASQGARVVRLQGNEGFLLIPAILSALYELKIAYVFVEGGAAVFSSFIRAGAADHLALFFSEKMFGEGKISIALPGYSAEKPLGFKNTSWRRIGEDILFEADLNRNA